MALTQQEQAELEQLQSLQPANVQQGLSGAEKTELTQLQQMQPAQESSTPLLEALGGKLPSTGQLPPQNIQKALGTTFGLGGVGVGGQPRTVNPEFQKEVTRRKAFAQLIERGQTPGQIELTLKAQKILDAPRIGRAAGGIGGAIATTALAGRVIPGPIDDALIIASLVAAGGAGAGGVIGEAAQTAIQEKRLISQREALSAFVNESVTEIGGRSLVGGVKLVASPLIKKAFPQAAALVDDFAKVGGEFSPTELDNRMSLRIGESFSRGSFGTKPIFQAFEEKQGKAALAFAEPIIESIGEGIARQTPEEIGEMFAEGITRPGGRVFNILDDLFDPLFKQVDEIATAGRQTGFRQAKAGGPAIRGAGGRFQAARDLQPIKLTPTVSTSKLKAFAKKNLATDTRLNGQFLSPAGKSKLEAVIGMEDKLTFSDMRTLRSSFLKDARKMARDVDQSQSIIKQLSGITDDAIFDPASAKGLSPEALNLLRNTNALYKSAQTGLKTTFSESLAKRLLKNPSNIVKEVFPNQNPKAIRLLRQSLVEPISGKPSAEGKVLWNQLRQQWLADAISEATKDGVAKPKVLNRVFSKMGTKALKEMFPESDISGNIKKIQSVFEIAGKAPPSGASLFSRGAQIGGLAMMYESGKEGDFVGFTAGSALAIGPLAFAKLATSPKGIKFLTSGFKMKPGASGLVPNAVRMVRLLREIDSQGERARLKTEKQARSKRFQRGQPTAEQLRGFGGRGF